MNQQQWEQHDQEFSLAEHIDRLELINAQIAAWDVEKRALTAAIISDIGHHMEGERTYQVGTAAVTCRTPIILALDKKAYESGEVYLLPEFDPIVTSKSYKVNRAKYETYLGCSPQRVREALDMLIEKKAGKPSVVIKK